MVQRLVAGVDCSTQGTKVLIVDVDVGRVVANGQAEHTVLGVGGARETDPEEWWSGLRLALLQTGLAAHVEAISIAAQQHGLVVCGSQGEPLRPAILWNDTRSAPEAEEIVHQLGGPASASSLLGSVPLAAFPVTSWAWLRRNEPRLVAGVSRVRMPHDWLTERLVGEGVTDRGDVSATGWWSTYTETYRDEVLGLAMVDLDPSLLPRVLRPNEPAGQVTSSAAEWLGLPAGIPVGAGTGDNPAAALGLGLEPGTPVMSLGTSGTVYTVSSLPARDPSGGVVGLADATGRYLPLVCTLNCTQAVDRVATWFGISRDDVSPDSNGVVVMPFFDGERTPYLPFATASVVGLRHATQPAEILRATYEGAIASLLDAITLIDSSSSGVDPAAPLTLIGGGARGGAWQDVVRRLAGRPVHIPDEPELAAYGAAVQAAGVLTGVPCASISRRWNAERGQLLAPIDGDTRVLDRIREVLRRLSDLNTANVSRAE